MKLFAIVVVCMAGVSGAGGYVGIWRAGDRNLSYEVKEALRGRCSLFNGLRKTCYHITDRAALNIHSSPNALSLTPHS